MKPYSEIARDLYSVHVASRRFCSTFLARVDKYRFDEGPNTMNRYGLNLDDVKLAHVGRKLLKEIVRPMAELYFPDTLPLKKVYGFLVDYEPNKQKGLSLHFDDSLLTLNVCLGREFKGGAIRFVAGKGKELVLDQEIGMGFLHRGHHQHRTEPVKSGRRTNLILWCK